MVEILEQVIKMERINYILLRIQRSDKPNMDALLARMSAENVLGYALFLQ